MKEREREQRLHDHFLELKAQPGVEIRGTGDKSIYIYILSYDSPQTA